MISRRALIAAGASVSLTAALGGAAWRAGQRGVFVEPGDSPAYAPWSLWHPQDASGIMSILRAAILAASPHNTQPWLFRLGENRIDLRGDRSRALGAPDPLLREFHQGLGCAIENMVQACAAAGFQTFVEIQPADAADSVARLHLSETAPLPGPLCEAIPRRHTHRGPYLRDQPPSAEDLTALAEAAARHGAAVRFLTEPEHRAAFEAMVIAATDAFIADPEMTAAGERWFRLYPEQIAENGDGLTLEAAGLDHRGVALTRFFGPPSSETANRAWAEATRNIHLATAPVMALMAVADPYSILGGLHAGRAWQRLHLEATLRGLVAQPLNQPLEMADREAQKGQPADFARRLAHLLGRDGLRPAFAFRLGRAARAAPLSPRRPAEAVVA